MSSLFSVAAKTVSGLTITTATAITEVGQLVEKKFLDKLGIDAEINELGYIAEGLGGQIDPRREITDPGTTPGVGALQRRQAALITLKNKLATVYLSEVSKNLETGLSYKDAVEYAYRAAKGAFDANMLRINKQFPRDISSKITKAATNKVKGDLGTLF